MLVPRSSTDAGDEDRSTAAPEQLLFVTPAEAPPEPAPPLPSAAEPTVPSARPTPRAPAAPVPAAPRGAPPRDTAAGGGAPRATPGAAPRRLPLPAVPSAGGAIEQSRAPVCWPPCLEDRVGPGRDGGTLTRAQRDSVLEAMAAGVVRDAGSAGSTGPRLGGAQPSSSPAAPPSVGGGVSIPVGLPGGGPSAASRRRDSTLNADVQRRMARIRARADSVAEQRRRDSVEQGARPRSPGRAPE
ncbi:MAG TPA: hypothetical protein VHQ45_19105 [Gemmatimonadaceae bacterium]|nr:hypothetical protein [Gemmatimonadaceae bacterium]